MKGAGFEDLPKVAGPEKSQLIRFRRPAALCRTCVGVSGGLQFCKTYANPGLHGFCNFVHFWFAWGLQVQNPLQLGVWCLGFRVYGVGFRVWGFEFRVRARTEKTKGESTWVTRS